jgi:uncharacterized membrane protein YfcA
MESLTSYLVLFGVGCIAGALNVVAGGGSFLTLPVLIFLGFPAIVANGTNRVGLLFQNLGAVWSFHRYQLVEWRALLWAAFPAVIGSVLGVWIAFSVGDELFRRILAFLMVSLTLLSLWNPMRREDQDSLHAADSATFATGRQLFLFAGGFFLVGIYGGFVQAGVGFLVLALTTSLGLDLVRGNAVKVLCILTFIVVSLMLFAWQGKVDWPTGFALAVGMTLGGQLGVKFTILKGHRAIRMVVTVTVLLFAVKLWLSG